jgi:hypothetical protein
MGATVAAVEVVDRGSDHSPSSVVVFVVVTGPFAPGAVVVTVVVAGADSTAVPAESCAANGRSSTVQVSSATAWSR